MCNVKLLLGNEEMTRTTCTAFVPFVDVVFIFFLLEFYKEWWLLQSIFNAESSYVRQSRELHILRETLWFNIPLLAIN